MFKRNPRTYARALAEFFYPRGGWYRAALYVVHRIRRLPDPANRISRGIAVGVFISFTPFFGVHILGAALLAVLIRGNPLAAVFATFFGNPVTFPLIVEFSMSFGAAILGQPIEMHLPQVLAGFAGATAQLWWNFLALFSEAEAQWASLSRFFFKIFLPYAVGGIPLGLVAGTVAFFLSRPVITAYQKRRIKKLRQRYEKRLGERIAKADARKKPR